MSAVSSVHIAAYVTQMVHNGSVMGGNPSMGVNHQSMGNNYPTFGGNYQSIGGSYQSVGGNHQSMGGNGGVMMQLDGSNVYKHNMVQQRPAPVLTVQSIELVSQLTVLLSIRY